MIIVSQDKTKIVNFDNLTQIYITQDEEETATFIRYEAIELCKREHSMSNILGYTFADYTPIYEMPEDWLMKYNYPPLER